MTSEFADQPDGFFGKLGPGSRVAGYLIEEQIGAGGMAVVFRARDEVLGRLAAVKVIAPSLANDEEFRARFLRESRTIAAVDSLHIIPVYAAGEAEGLLYIATRFVPGGDLAMLMRRSGGRLAADRTASLIAQVASALDAAHAAGLVHRDVKPQNILVDTVPERPEHAFLSDFGLSKGTQSSTALTVSGQFLGTPDYSAPEQIRSEHVDGRADQYALACVAFVLLTGELPFHRPETVATMFAHVNDPVPLVTRLRPELPPAVNDVIVRALAKSAAGRYGRCGEFAAALREALVQARPAAVPDPYAWLARRDGAARIPSGHRARQPPARFAPPTSSPPARSPAPQPAARPQPAVRSLPAAGPQPPQNADWVHPSLPPTFAAEWEKAIQANAAYANTTTSGKRRPGRRRVPLAGGPRRRLQRRNFQTALIGGAAAVVIGAAGAVYAAGLHGSSAGAVSVGSSAAQRPGKPALAATLTVPGGGTVDTVWISPDGKRIAASGKGSKIYIWNRASPAHPVTLTAPNMRVGKSSYSPVIDNVAFSANDASLTVAEYPQAPPSANEQSYAVYRWDLAAGKRTAVWSISTPSTVSFSGDNNEAVDSQHGGVRTVALSSAAAAGPRIALPGGTGLSPSTPYNVDLNGTDRKSVV